MPPPPLFQVFIYCAPPNFHTKLMVRPPTLNLLPPPMDRKGRLSLPTQCLGWAVHTPAESLLNSKPVGRVCGSRLHGSDNFIVRT